MKTEIKKHYIKNKIIHKKKKVQAILREILQLKKKKKLKTKQKKTFKHHKHNSGFREQHIGNLQTCN